MNVIGFSVVALTLGVTSASAQSCRQTAGMVQAQMMVRQCAQVSQMSHPPCNVENSCDMMVEEINRGCDTLLKELPAHAPAFCRSRSALAAPNPVTASGLAHYECPAVARGRRLLNWSLVDSHSSRGVPSNLATGAGTVKWSLTPAQSAQGSVQIACGYEGTSEVVNVPIALGIKHCQNPEMTHEYMCDSK